MKKADEHGNVTEVVIIVVLVLCIVGLIIWRVVDSSQKSSTSNQASQTASKQSDASTTPATPADPNKGYVVIEDWGVRFKPSSSEQIQYDKSGSGGDSYRFTTATAKKINDCSDPDSWLWLVERRTSKDEVAGGLMLNNGNKIGDYYYYYYHTQEMCAVNAGDQTAVEQQIKIVQDSILTIEAKQ